MTTAERDPHGAAPRGSIVIAATPLGNIGDATDRLRVLLAEADLIAAEDTRRVRTLAHALGVEITGQVVSNYDHNEQGRIPQLLAAATAGQCVAVVSDAGMPAINDPGLAVVQAAVAAGVPVTCLPGPSAVTTAVVLSGLQVTRFAFDGFAPRKQGERTRWLESLRTEGRAVVFFDSPHRIADTVAAIIAVLGPERPLAVCRELTKTYEEAIRGTASEVAEHLAEHPARGEITAVIGPAVVVSTATVEELIAAAAELVAAGVRAKDAAKQVAAGTEFSPREVYAGLHSS